MCVKHCDKMMSQRLLYFKLNHWKYHIFKFWIFHDSLRFSLYRLINYAGLRGVLVCTPFWSNCLHYGLLDNQAFWTVYKRKQPLKLGPLLFKKLLYYVEREKINTDSGLIFCHWSPRGRGEKESSWKKKYMWRNNGWISQVKLKCTN